jgi:hypothetical protein
MNTMKKYTTKDAIERINGRLTKNQKSVVYYDDNAGRYYLAPIGDITYLTHLMNDEDPDIARDAYSHWCSWASHPECDVDGNEISDHAEQAKLKFTRLSRSRVKELMRQARSFIENNPGCANHSAFWIPRGMTTGLSARQVIEIGRAIW